MTPIYIAIWTKGHDPLDSIIKWITHGTGTHAAFVRNDRVVENFYPHVRERAWKPGEKAKVAIFEIEGANIHDYSDLDWWLDEQLRTPPNYSIRDLFRYALGWPPLRGNRCFCSQFVLRGIRATMPKKQLLTRLPAPDWASPRDLLISPRLREVDARHRAS